mgnify:CR=1 FL=1
MRDRKTDQFMRPVLDDVRNNPGAEIIRYGRNKPNILSLGSGESDMPTPAFIGEAVQKALAQGHTNYGPVLGRTELRQALSAYYKDIYGLDISADRMMVTISGSAAMHLALRAIVERGDEVIAITPIWKNLLGSITLRQANIRDVALDFDGQKWQFDPHAIFEKVTDKTKAILINSPNNPTGWVMPEDQMRTILEWARAKGIWIISDEVYSRLVFDEKRAPSFLDVAGEDDRVLTVNSFSKNWAMTGWRLGWLVGPPKAVDLIYNIILYENMGASNFMQFGAVAALKKGENFVSDFKDHCRSNLDILMDRFDANPKIIAYEPQSTFYSFFAVRGEDDCMNLAKRLIDEQSLCLGPGCSFGRKTKGYLRMCFAVSEAKLIEALDRLEAAL